MTIAQRHACVCIEDWNDFAIETFSLEYQMENDINFAAKEFVAAA